MQQRLRESEQTATAAPRFDNDSVRDILARATEIEARQNTTALTANQIETLAKELGLSPDAVRQALQEKSHSLGQTATPVRQGLLPVTRQDVKTAAKMAVVLSAIAFLVIIGLYLLFDTSHTAVITMSIIGLCYLAAVVCVIPFLYAWRRTDWRQGVILTTALLLFDGPATLLGIIIGSGITMRVIPSLDSVPVPGIILASLASGIVGGLAGKWWHDRKLAEER